MSVLPVLPVYKPPNNTKVPMRLFNTEICGSLKRFTFKAYKLLIETINRYKNDSSTQFLHPTIIKI
jgi:hypothetical protein